MVVITPFIVSRTLAIPIFSQASLYSQSTVDTALLIFSTIDRFAS